MTDESDIRELLEAHRLREAFERIVERFQEKVFHLALSLTRNHSTAADLAQEAFLRLWKALPGYNGTASLSTWIYTITRNACLTELKRLSRKQAVSLDAPESEGLVESLAVPEGLEAGAVDDIASSLSKLPEHYRRVLELFYLEQKSYEETAVLLGVPMGTVKTHLFRARRELIRLANAQRASQPLSTTGVAP